MNGGQIAAAVLGCIAVFLVLGAAREIRKARTLLEEQEIGAARTSWDEHVNHPSVMHTRRLCPPRGPDDDPEFINSLRRQS